MTTKVLNKAAGNENKEEEDRWSNLTALLLWRIKDRLDFPNNLQFAAVCNNWQHASSTYTRNYLHIPPWIMITRCGAYETTRDFISTLTRKKYTIDLVDFFRVRTLFSNQGWLLLEDMGDFKDFHGTSRLDARSDPSIFLLNPFTKRKIEFPSRDAKAPSGGSYECDFFQCGAFTVVEGIPDLVVATKLSFEHLEVCPTVNVWTIRRGDNKWNKHSYTRFQPRSFIIIVRVLIVGQLLYIFNESSAAIVLNLSNLRWTDLMQHVERVPSEFINSNYIVERKGEIYECRYHKKSGESGPVFYKLNATCTAWEPLKDENLKDNCWFLKGPGFSSFMIKDKWSDEVCRGLEENGYNSVKVRIHDANMMARKFLLDPSPVDSAEWVDLG